MPRGLPFYLKPLAPKDGLLFLIRNNFLVRSFVGCRKNSYLLNELISCSLLILMRVCSLFQFSDDGTFLYTQQWAFKFFTDTFWHLCILMKMFEDYRKVTIPKYSWVKKWSEGLLSCQLMVNDYLIRVFSHVTFYYQIIFFVLYNFVNP